MCLLFPTRIPLPTRLWTSQSLCCILFISLSLILDWHTIVGTYPEPRIQHSRDQEVNWINEYWFHSFELLLNFLPTSSTLSTHFLLQRIWTLGLTPESLDSWGKNMEACTGGELTFHPADWRVQSVETGYLNLSCTKHGLSDHQEFDHAIISTNMPFPSILQEVFSGSIYLTDKLLRGWSQIKNTLADAWHSKLEFLSRCHRPYSFCNLRHWILASQFSSWVNTVAYWPGIFSSMSLWSPQLGP